MQAAPNPTEVHPVHFGKRLNEPDFGGAVFFFLLLLSGSDEALLVITGLTAASLPSGSPVGFGEGTRRGVPKLTCRASELN